MRRPGAPSDGARAPWAGPALAAALAAAAACRAHEPSPAAAGAREVTAAIARVESGQRPPVPIAGEPLWELSDRMRFHGVPGVSLAVIDGFEVAWARAYGVADRGTGEPVGVETLFQASSMSKPIAAVLTLRLAAAGALALGDDVNLLLRSWKVPDHPWSATAPVTPERILSHSAGLSVHGSPGFAEDEPRATLLAMLDGLPPANVRPVRVEAEPGPFLYSGGGYMVLQQALEDSSGRRFGELASEEVLAPLDLRRSTFAHPPPAAEARLAVGHGMALPGRFRIHVDLAAAGLWTTAEEYARFVADLQRAAAGRPARLLKPPAARDLLRRRTAATALGVFLVPRGGATYFGHGGANWGYQSLFLAHPEAGYGVVVLANAEAGEPLCWEIVRSVAAAYGWDYGLAAPAERRRASAESLAAASGSYFVDADGALTVERRGGELWARETLGDEFELVPLGGDRYLRRGSEWEYRFARRTGTAESVARRSLGEEWEEPWLRRLTAGQLPTELLVAGRIGEAVAALAALRARSPEDRALGLDRLEGRGRELLRRGHGEAATALLEFAAELYPGSSAVLDALAEAHLAGGRPEEAARISRRVLEAVATDPVARASWRVVYRERAEARLAELEAGSEGRATVSPRSAAARSRRGRPSPGRSAGGDGAG